MSRRVAEKALWEAEGRRKRRRPRVGTGAESCDGCGVGSGARLTSGVGLESFSEGNGALCDDDVILSGGLMLMGWLRWFALFVGFVRWGNCDGE
jgi:hypothetical protein